MRAVRRLVRLLALVGVVAGAAAVARRRLAGPGERIDLYFFDGSMTSLDPEAPESAHMLVLARDALAAARDA